MSDLISNQERFTMRALKGIRKEDSKKLKINLLISFSWLMAVVNRFHIDIEEAVWKRFPRLCSYCGHLPCSCKKTKPKKRTRITRQKSLKPATLAEFQEMFEKIYPASSRTLFQAGVHLAEEMGELSEAVHHFLGNHKTKTFSNLIEEAADYISCIFGVANSAKIDMAEELAKMYATNCHICHRAPCVCNFSFISQFRS